MSKPEELSKLQKLLLDIQQADRDYIAKLKVSEPLEADLKSFLAAIKNEMAGIKNEDGKRPSESQIEREALGNPNYRAHLQTVVTAKLETIQAERRYEELCKWFDCLRSELAMERETIKRAYFTKEDKC